MSAQPPPPASPNATTGIPPTVAATTTTVTVTTETPGTVVPVKWYRSQKFKAYVGSWLTLVFGWLMQCISSNTLEWKALAITSLGMAGLVVKDWMQADVVAPFDSLNKNNVKAGRP